MTLDAASLRFELRALFQCPVCASSEGIDVEGEALRCRSCAGKFPIAQGRIDFLQKKEILPAGSQAPRNKGSRGEHLYDVVRAVIPSADINLAQERVLRMLGREMAERNSPVILVIGCGRQAAKLRSYLAAAAGMHLLLTDVNPDTDAEWLCDAHHLPFADGVIDAVIGTAVLEHVARPPEAVAEIHRVLKVGGLLYSEIPFMQQVHEGAYDFTRYTLTGHRMLFSDFTEREAGVVAGPGTGLLWSIEYFAMAFFRGRTARLGARLIPRLLFFWLKYFDYFLVRHRAFAADGASCTFFYGEKTGSPTDATSILATYGKMRCESRAAHAEPAISNSSRANAK